MMMAWLLIWMGVVYVTSDGIQPHRVVGMNEMRRRDLIRLHRANSTTLAADHEVLLGLTQLNIDVLERELAERSDPANALKYQQWMSFDEVGSIFRNEAATRAVTEWLEENKVTVSWTAPHGDYIRAVAPLRTWERVLSAEFHVWEDASTHRIRHHIRSETYSIPASLSSSLSAVFNVADFPGAFTPRVYRRSRGKEKETTSGRAAPPAGLVGRLRVALQAVYPGTTVGFLNAFYHIQSNIGRGDVSQAVYETNDQYFSQGT